MAVQKHSAGPHNKAMDCTKCKMGKSHSMSSRPQTKVADTDSDGY